MPPDLPHGRVFVVQFGGDADPGQGRWLGRVEHVDSGRTRRFASAQDLNVFFACVLGKEEEGTGEESSETDGPICKGGTR